MDDAEYFSTPALSASLAKALLRSPAHAKAMLDNPSTPTPSMVFGTVVHGLVLEPKRQDIYTVAREDARTKAGKEERAALKEAGLPIITAKDEIRALRVRDAVLNHPLAFDFLSKAPTREAAFFWNGHLNVPHKAKIDALGSNIIVDIKTTQNADPIEFTRTIFNLRYHCQAAQYQTAFEREYGTTPRFIFIAVEVEGPFNVSIFELDNAALDEGRRLMRRAAALYKACMESGEWPGYPPMIHEARLPPWLQPSFEEMDF